MRDVLVLTQSPFTERDHGRFGVAVLRQRYRVSILDCTPWLRPDIWAKYHGLAFRCEGYVAVANWSGFTSRLPAARSVAVDFLSSGKDARSIRAELRRRGIWRAIVHNGLQPDVAASSVDRIRRSLSGQGPAALLKRAWGVARRLVKADPAPEIALLSGAAGLTDARVQGAVHRIWAHSFDYDVYLDLKAQAPLPGAPYIVFLDEDMVHHSDYDHLGLTPPTTEQAYYPAMNRFFDALETAFGMRVVVAAHPRARYDLRPHLWNGRAVRSAATAQLVRDAALVVCHESTALSFAVLWRKPIVLVTTDDLAPTRWGRGIALRSSLLGAPLLNADHDAPRAADVRRTLAVDSRAYDEYTEQYIKRRGTPEQPAWQIFSDYVCRGLDAPASPIPG